MQPKAFLSWSGGKDSALALHRIAVTTGQTPGLLLCNLEESTQRVSMHGVRRELVEAQAASLNIPLHFTELPAQPSMDVYEQLQQRTFEQLRKEGFGRGFFGDIFLEDLRQYREQQLIASDLEAAFPLWKEDSLALLNEVIGLGYRARVIAVNNAYLPAHFCGRELDRAFLNDLPAGVDPCGENGEYHSFVYDGPTFSKPVIFSTGEITYREYPAPHNAGDTANRKASIGFYFQDLLPVS